MEALANVLMVAIATLYKMAVMHMTIMYLSTSNKKLAVNLYKMTAFLLKEQ